MNIIYTILAALPIGFFAKTRSGAVLTYLSVGAIVFSFQSVGVVLDWLSNNQPVAFGSSPSRFPITYSHSQFWGYGLINLLIFSVGVSLTLLGGYLAERRASKRNTAKSRNEERLSDRHA